MERRRKCRAQGARTPECTVHSLTHSLTAQHLLCLACVPLHAHSHGRWVALGQVCHFDLQRAMSPDAVLAGINHQILLARSGWRNSLLHRLRHAPPPPDSNSAPHLPPQYHSSLRFGLASPYTLRVLQVTPVPDTFHARFSALSKTYAYSLLVPTESRSGVGRRPAPTPPTPVSTDADSNALPPASTSTPAPAATNNTAEVLEHGRRPERELRPPILGPPLSEEPFAWALTDPIDMERVTRAARDFLGTHNFAAFRGADCTVCHATSPHFTWCVIT